MTLPPLLQFLTGVDPATVNWNNPLANQTGQGGPAGGGIATTNYQDAIQQGLMQALGGNAQGNQTAAQQTQLAQALQTLAQHGSGLANMQLNQATGVNEKNAAANIASLRGLNPGTAAMDIANQTAQINQGAAGQSAIQQAQEQLAALGQLGGTLGTQRGQDIAQQNANTALTTGLGGEQDNQNKLALGLQGLQQSTASTDAQLRQGAETGNAQIGGQETGLILQGLGIGATGAGLPGKPPPPTASHGLQVPYYAGGGRIPGKGAYPGDDPRNDTRLIRAAPGEDIIPASIAKDPKLVVEFIRALNRGSGRRNTDVGVAMKKARAALAQVKSR